MPRGNVAEKAAADVAEALEDKITTIFAVLSGIAPISSVYAVENSPKAIAALVSIGKRRPAVMRVLTTVANGADGLEIAKFILGVVCALQVDFGKLNGDELPARLFGVTEILEEHFLANDETTPNPGVTEQVTNGQRFTPVS